MYKMDRKIKKNLKRTLCLLLAVIMGFTAFPGTVWADEQSAAEEKLDIVDGHVTLYDYKKMSGFSDILAKKDKGWFNIIFVYDAKKDDVSTRRVLTGNDNTFYNYKNKSYTEMRGEVLDNSNFGNFTISRFINDKPVTNMWIKVVGVNSGDNAGMPMFKISLGSEPGKKYLVAHEDDEGFRTSTSDGTTFTLKTRGSDTDNYIVCEDIRGGCVDASWQESSNDRNGIWIERRTIYSAESWYKKFSVYIADAVEYDAITKEHQIMAGDTARINANVILTDKGKINVDEGGVFLVEGMMFNNGEINNKGTVIVSNGAKIQPYLSSGGNINCDGGDLIVESGGRVVCEKALQLKNGASLVNNGVCIVGENIDIIGSLVDNRVSGMFYEGYMFNDSVKTYSYIFSDSELESEMYKVMNVPVTNILGHSKMINYGKIYRNNRLNVADGNIFENRDSGKVN